VNFLISFFVYFRSVIFTFVYFPIVTVFFASTGIILTKIVGHRRPMKKVTQAWSRWTLFFLSIKIIETGRENVPENSACLYLFNHTSFLDILAMASRLDKVHFGAKIELFKIPIFGASMKVAGVLPIARQKRDEVMKVYKEAEARATLGEQFALAPEGGRNAEEVLLPFKSGPFIFAINAKLPIVPVVILGASQLWKKGTFLPAINSWRSEIHIHYLKKVDVSEYQVANRVELSTKVREMMLPYFPLNDLKK
jgi:1-acyl-sn-glycerol-3-phosphate acyltransferase